MLYCAGDLQSPDKPFGTHAFTLTGPDSDPRHMKWLAIGLDCQARINMAGVRT